jgi:hypothetical protein
MGSSIPKHVTTTCSRITVIQSFLGFVKGEVASKNGINPLTIKSITEDNILMGLVVYAMVVSARKIKLESLGMEIYDDIPAEVCWMIYTEYGMSR